jgi:hypothetical protein
MKPGDAAGYVVCCNGSKTTCADDSQLSGSGLGKTIKIKCVLEHEKEHFKHVDCPGGADECKTTRPPFKDPPKAGEQECDAYKVEVACLQASSCGGDATCQALVDARIALAKGAGNTNKPGCFP